MKDYAVEILDLNYSYPDGRKALHGINLTVNKGDTVGLIGHNGAGKSTLIMLLNGVFTGKGTIKIAGLTLEKKNLKEIRKSVGVVFQNPDDQLFMPTVFDDIAFGPLNFGLSCEDVKNRVDEVIKAMKLEGFEDRLPHHLSTGEKKRVSIATVLSMRPSIIVLDEPSSNLDPKGRRELIRLLKTIEGTKIIATHDLELVLEICNKVILMGKGKVITEGETVRILSNEKLLDENDLEKPLSLKE
jgi:cobalt/nickel transport system ATP-binding protein